MYYTRTMCGLLLGLGTFYTHICQGLFMRITGKSMCFMFIADATFLYEFSSFLRIMGTRLYDTRLQPPSTTEPFKCVWNLKRAKQELALRESVPELINVVVARGGRRTSLRGMCVAD